MLSIFLLSLIFTNLHGVKNNCEPKPSDCTEWDYESHNDALYWKLIAMCPDTKCPAANGQQSPINIVSSSALTTCSSVAQLQMTGLEAEKFEIENDAGHFNILVTPEGTSPFGTLTNGIDEVHYRLANIHLHWPSEHTIDGVHYAAEAHFVHYKGSHGNLGTAIASGDNNALAVVAILFEIGSSNAFLKKIADDISKITEGCHHMEIEDVKLTDLLPSSLDPFYKYEGSLTTPKCNPVVLWHIVQNKMTMTQNTLNAFQTLKGGYGVTYSKNYRDVQTLGNSLFTCGSSGGSDDDGDDKDSEEDDDALLWDFQYRNNTKLLLVVSVFIVLTLVNTLVIIYKHCTRNTTYVHVPVHIVEKDMDIDP